MKTVHKYQITDFPLQAGQNYTLEMAAFSTPLRLERQGNHLCLWMEVEFIREVHDAYTLPVGNYNLILHPTGGDIKDNETYMGTFFDGPYVWHLYRRPV